VTYVVVSAVPFHLMTEPETKFPPFTVSVNVSPPAVALEGDRDVIDGTGLLMAKITAPEVPPPGVGLETVTLAVPVLEISPAGTCAVTCVVLTNVVVSAVPFQFTAAPVTKPVPVAVNVKAAPPTVVLVGDSDVSVGTALLMPNVVVPEVPPPGVGLVTVILADPALTKSVEGT
jgi:hypothetical protein